MNRHSVFALVLAAAAAAAFADDITIDTTPFVSTKSRADVVAEYQASRREVAALTAEDSGSAYLVRARDARTQAVRLAGQPTQAQ